MPRFTKYLIAICLIALAGFVASPTIAAKDTSPKSATTQVSTDPVVTQDIPRVVEYRFRETNAKVSDLRIHIYLGLLGLFLLNVILFLYFKWNVQSMHMSIDNLKRRQDDLIKLLQMNNGKLKQNIDKLERSLYDLSEIQVQITKKMNTQDQAQADTQAQATTQAQANKAQANKAQTNMAQAAQDAASKAHAKPAPAPPKHPTK